MADPLEKILGAARQGADKLRALQDEVAPRDQSDPFQSAYDQLNQITEESFKQILDSPIGGQNQLAATAQLAQESRSVRQSIDIAKDPIKGYGGRELVSAFENQDQDFPVNAETYGRRVKLAGIMQQIL